MALVLEEPGIMSISRTPERLETQANSKDDNYIDYRKLPRSSGDGMEHSSNNSDPNIHFSNTSPSYQDLKTIDKPTSFRKIDVSKHQAKPQYAFPNNTEKYRSQDQSIPREKFEEVSLTSKVQGCENESLNDSRNSRKGFHREMLPSLIVREDESVMSYSASNSKLYDSGKHLDKDIANLETVISVDHENLTSDSIRTVSHEEYFKMQSVIKDLEDRHAKLVEDKTKLCVQLGLQSEVNAELKKLVVAAVGEDLENNLEALLMRNAQSAVEIKHWKTLSEEYAEESDKLAIECDVWRTKFMASRMMSDELSSWKTTLYTKFKQMQNALQRILNEREELKKYLIKTKRLLHTLNYSIHPGGAYNAVPEIDNHNQRQQSVLELASLTSCLVQDLAAKTLCDYQGNAVSTESFTVSPSEKQNLQPTAGEKLALQVLTSDVDLPGDKQQEDSSVIKRLGKQYIGNSHHSRLMTNSFRVTYDCCDRCKGPVQVV